MQMTVDLLIAFMTSRMPHRRNARSFRVWLVNVSVGTALGRDATPDTCHAPSGLKTTLARCRTLVRTQLAYSQRRNKA
jgi:hypothetical protein